MNTYKASLRPIHPFPARMAPSILQRRLQSKEQLRVLDPMVGSGTTIVAARLYGHIAIGFDTDPLALVIAKAWSSNVNPLRLQKRAEEVLSQAKKTYRNLSHAEAYPDKSDAETRAFIRFWFDPTNRRQLKALSVAILRVKNDNERSLLWSAFSRLIVTKDAGASLARDVSHSRPHKAYKIAPIRPFEAFRGAVDRILQASHFLYGNELPAAEVTKGDARKLPLQNESIDLVVTSPPYLNAIDYLRGHKLSLVWMRHSIRAIRNLRAQSIGTESPNYPVSSIRHIQSALRRMCDFNKLSTRSRNMLIQYAHDMDSVLSEISRVLRHHGEAILVVGNSTIRGVFINNSSALARLARVHGLKLNSTRRRPLMENRRYLPPPGKRGSGRALRSRMREEVILTLAKSTTPTTRVAR